MGGEKLNKEAHISYEKWKEGYAHIKKHARELLHILDARFGEDGVVHYFKILKKIRDTLIRKGFKHNEIAKHASYHILFGSTPCYKSAPKIDLPGDESILGYIKKYIEENRALVSNTLT